MSPSTADLQQRYADSLQPHVPEPILAVGLLSRVGAMGRTLLWKASPLAAMAHSQLAKKKASGLPTNVVVAVTATRVHLFDFRPKGSSIKVKGEPTVWDRAGFQGWIDAPGTLSTRVRLQFADGTTVELDANRAMPGYADFNTPMLDLLTAAGGRGGGCG